MSEPVTYYNRYTKKVETEAIYGEGFLRWAYEKQLGHAAVWLMVKRSFFSKWYGARMSKWDSRARVLPFIEKYGISVEEMAGEAEWFPTFNAFFARRLKASARPIVPGPETIALPADGRHFAIPDVAKNEGIFVKGVSFNLTALLGDAVLAEKYSRGSLLISRLCPVDYHRFHFPASGVPGKARLINGPLYSVSPVALRQRPTLLWENKRYITVLKTEAYGEVIILEVGATCVGAVHQTYRLGNRVNKGEEKGYFTFGGSCVITLFEPERVKFSEDLLEQSAQGLEVYARMGDEMARSAAPSEDG